MFIHSLWNHPLPLLQWGAVIGASLIAAATDVATGKIPNRLVGPVCLAGFAASFAYGGLAGLADSFLACIALAAPFIVLFVFAGGGAGDAKLMGAIGAWLGLMNGAVALVAVIAAGAIVGLLIAIFRGRFAEVLGRVRDMMSSWYLYVKFRAVPSASDDASADVSAQMITMPYGVAILGGVCTAAMGTMLWRGGI